MKTEMIKKTFKELMEIDEFIGTLYTEKPELKNSKFGYSYKRFAEKNFYPLLKKFREELLDIRIDNALEDEKTKEIIADDLNPRGYKYNKEGLKKLVIAERILEEEWFNKEIKVEPYICKKENLPELNIIEKEMLLGVLI